MRTSSVVLALVLVARVAAAQPSKAEDESAALVAEGRAALRRGALDDAAKALDQAIALNPRRVEAYVLRSAVYAARKQYADDVALLRRAQALAPADIDVLTALGSGLVLAGDVDAGVPLLEQVVRKDPARYDAQLLLGHRYHQIARWGDAIGAYEAYFAHRPADLANEDARYQIDLADAYLRDRRAAKALALFERIARDHDDPRAQLGIAWATAALDCKQARALFRELDALAQTHPEIWLVDGQCALALGDAAVALDRGRRYLERGPRGAAAGHGLVADALAARGNFAEARKELEAARRIEPAQRRWAVRLATVQRKAGDLAGALATLEQLGPPATAAQDPAWWTELGETLLAKGDAAGVVAKLSPIARDLERDAGLRIVLGAAQLAAGQGDAAVKTLDEAEAITSTPRGKKLLADALTTVAAGKLSANDAAAAEPLLARASTLADSPIILRDLGIARLALDRPADAATVLDRAVRTDLSPLTLMLAARAHAIGKDVAAARPLYERALATERDNPIEIAIDWAASELTDGGDPNVAVAALEKTQPQAKSGPLAQRHKAALAEARHAAGVAALRAGNGAKAVELLKASVAANPTLATRCDLALATVVAGDGSAALAALHAVSGQSCPFPPPADLQAAPILIAFTEGLDPRRASKALDRLTALAGKSTGPAAALLGTATRVVALAAAQDAYHAGSAAQARKYLTIARGANARIGTDDVAHNLAVLDLADGKVDAAIAQLERLSAKLPESLVNLGIAYEKKGDHKRALDAWRRARKAGVRFAPLAEWIESKERIYGGGP